jgi:hypothetical protein
MGSGDWMMMVARPFTLLLAALLLAGLPEGGTGMLRAGGATTSAEVNGADGGGGGGALVAKIKDAIVAAEASMERAKAASGAVTAVVAAHTDPLPNIVPLTKDAVVANIDAIAERKQAFPESAVRAELEEAQHTGADPAVCQRCENFIMVIGSQAEAEETPEVWVVLGCAHCPGLGTAETHTPTTATPDTAVVEGLGCAKCRDFILIMDSRAEAEATGEWQKLKCGTCPPEALAAVKSSGTGLTNAEEDEVVDTTAYGPQALSDIELGHVKTWRAQRQSILEITNGIFYVRHPARRRSAIGSSETAAIAEWKQINKDVTSRVASIKPHPPPPQKKGAAPPVGDRTFAQGHEPPAIVALRAKGYTVYEHSSNEGPPNLIGVRTENTMTNRFDDRLIIAWKHSDGRWRQRTLKATTDPGQHWLDNPLNADGTAILKPGQYLNTYCRGKHRSQYAALVQRGGNVRVWRRKASGDFSGKNGKNVLASASSENDRKVFDGKFGINIHRSNAKVSSTRVGKYSAGCQVVADPTEFNQMLEQVTTGLEALDDRGGYDGGNACAHYTLLVSKDIGAEPKEAWEGPAFHPFEDVFVPIPEMFQDATRVDKSFIMAGFDDAKLANMADDLKRKLDKGEGGDILFAELGTAGGLPVASDRSPDALVADVGLSESGYRQFELHPVLHMKTLTVEKASTFTGALYIQVGAFSNIANAERLASVLAERSAPLSQNGHLHELGKIGDLLKRWSIAVQLSPINILGEKVVEFTRVRLGPIRNPALGIALLEACQMAAATKGAFVIN